MTDSSGVVVGLLLAAVIVVILFLFAPQVWVSFVTREVKNNPELYSDLTRSTCPTTSSTTSTPATTSGSGCPPATACPVCEVCPDQHVTCPMCPTCPTCPTSTTTNSTSCPTTQAPSSTPSKIPTGSTIVGPADILRNGTWLLTMQMDGNVVLYDGLSSKSATSTNNPTLFVTHLTFTPDAQLIFYTKDNIPVATISPKSLPSGNTASFALSDSGELSIVNDSTKEILWQGILPKGALPT